MDLLIEEVHDGFNLGKTGIFLKRSEGWTPALAQACSEIVVKLAEGEYERGDSDGYDRGRREMRSCSRRRRG